MRESTARSSAPPLARSHDARARSPRLARLGASAIDDTKFKIYQSQRPARTPTRSAARDARRARRVGSGIEGEAPRRFATRLTGCAPDAGADILYRPCVTRREGTRGMRRSIAPMEGKIRISVDRSIDRDVDRLFFCTVASRSLGPRAGDARGAERRIARGVR